MPSGWRRPELPPARPAWNALVCWATVRAYRRPFHGKADSGELPVARCPAASVRPRTPVVPNSRFGHLPIALPGNGKGRRVTPGRTPACGTLLRGTRSVPTVLVVGHGVIAAFSLQGRTAAEGYRPAVRPCRLFVQRLTAGWLRGMKAASTRGAACYRPASSPPHGALPAWCGTVGTVLQPALHPPPAGDSCSVIIRVRRVPGSRWKLK